eukprot:CAMPEP_0201253064 /NCGR_PEP_ID=MMETSP0852-20130820/67251_1 /ASSEMBLY_ACC=CAM_ASM_000632 /TAXON_ID=183588 /ORGANISM="Pseudo-nitzschia fraudulenta, Strain WWA7" /LENGTH=405 /DNA_ID=CAMNT_0047552827 /DNA_START=957 /DNA_END=2174 /DNA_ORIENTATION=-
MPRTKTTAMPTAGRRFRLVFVLVAGLAVLLDSFSIGRNTALVSKTELSAAAGRQGKSGAGLDRNGEEEGEPSSSPAAKPPVPQTNKDDANDRFSVFASEQTPLLAELLATQTNNGESDDKNERSGGDNSSLPSAPPRAGSAATTADNPGTEAPAFVYSSLRQRSPEIAIVGLATVAVSGILGDLLSEYEWVQALRYFWPLSIGVYYGTLLNQAADGNSGGNGRLARMREEFGPDVAVNPDASADDDCDGEPSSSSSSSSSSNPVLQLQPRRIGRRRLRRRAIFEQQQQQQQQPGFAARIHTGRCRIVPRWTGRRRPTGVDDGPELFDPRRAGTRLCRLVASSGRGGRIPGARAKDERQRQHYHNDGTRADENSFVGRALQAGGGVFGRSLRDFPNRDFLVRVRHE